MQQPDDDEKLAGSGTGSREHIEATDEIKDEKDV
jgi:hypothetical protein